MTETTKAGPLVVLVHGGELTKGARLELSGFLRRMAYGENVRALVLEAEPVGARVEVRMGLEAPLPDVKLQQHEGVRVCVGSASPFQYDAQINALDDSWVLYLLRGQPVRLARRVDADTYADLSTDVPLPQPVRGEEGEVFIAAPVVMATSSLVHELAHHHGLIARGLAPAEESADGAGHWARHRAVEAELNRRVPRP